MPEKNQTGTISIHSWQNLAAAFGSFSRTNPASLLHFTVIQLLLKHILRLDPYKAEEVPVIVQRKAFGRDILGSTT